jgi:hypothetical protein
MHTEEIMRIQKKPEAAETMELLTIGKVAKLAGVGVETIRFYEREGVLPKPHRKVSGYRLFDLETVRRLQSHPQSSGRRLFLERGRTVRIWQRNFRSRAPD